MNDFEYHIRIGIFSYRIIEEAYRSCCYGVAEPNKIILPFNGDLYERFIGFCGGINMYKRFHNAEIHCSNIPSDEIHFINTKEPTELRFNCILMISKPIEEVDRKEENVNS